MGGINKSAVGEGIGSVDAVGEEDYSDLEWTEIGGVWRVTRMRILLWG